MDILKAIKEETLHKGYYTLKRIFFPDGANREILFTSDSVACLVYLVDTHQVVLVQQFRASTQSPEHPTGMITELVAGRIDRQASPEQILLTELQEEIGAQVQPSQITWLNNGRPMTLSAGALSERCHMALVCIESSMIEADCGQTFGNAHEHERIQRQVIGIDQFLTMDCSDIRVLAMQYYLRTYLQEVGHATPTL